VLVLRQCWALVRVLQVSLASPERERFLLLGLPLVGWLVGKLLGQEVLLPMAVGR
jgi:hypothetical protein